MTKLDDLKHSIQTEWTKLDHAVIAASVHQWRRCLSGWVKAGDGHFEHCFWFRHCVFSDNYDLSYCCWSVEQTKQNQTIKPNRPSYLLYILCWQLMSTEFGLLIDFDVLKARTNAKPEVVFSDRGRHLEKSIWCHISAVADPEWHVNNGDEVKIETEKSKEISHSSYRRVNPDVIPM